MARTITWDELRDLAGFEAEKGCAISLYLDLDPRLTPTPGAAVTRLHSLLDEAATGDGANRRALTHDQRLELGTDFERIRDFYQHEFESDAARERAICPTDLHNSSRTRPPAKAVMGMPKLEGTTGRAPRCVPVRRRNGAQVVVVDRKLEQVYRQRGGWRQDPADQTEQHP